MIRFHRAVSAGANFPTRMTANIEQYSATWTPYDCVVILGGFNDIHRLQEYPECVKPTWSASSGSGSSSLSSDSGSISISNGSGAAALISAAAVVASAVYSSAVAAGSVETAAAATQSAATIISWLLQT